MVHVTCPVCAEALLYRQVISLGEFTVLELLRLRRITTEDLEMIRAVFDQIDDAKTGTLDKPMLARKQMLRGYGSFDEVDLLRKVSRVAVGVEVDLQRWWCTPGA